MVSRWVFLGFLGCSTSLPSDSGEGVTTSGGGSTVQTGVDSEVVFTVYVDDTCTELPPADSTVVLDATAACNETPDASISELVCFADRITYLNHPNNPDCSSDGIFNELPVGVCTQFPGPVATWKYIDPETYDCRTVSP